MFLNFGVSHLKIGPWSCQTDGVYNNRFVTAMSSNALKKKA